MLVTDAYQVSFWARYPAPRQGASLLAIRLLVWYVARYRRPMERRPDVSPHKRACHSVEGEDVSPIVVGRWFVMEMLLRVAY